MLAVLVATLQLEGRRVNSCPFSVVKFAVNPVICAGAGFGNVVVRFRLPGEFGLSDTPMYCGVVGALTVTRSMPAASPELGAAGARYRVPGTFPPLVA